MPALPRFLLVCVAVGAAGCTMCPDPYDYVGTVPNGSASQNDFRARSNGIVPLGAAPHPFPTVVKAVPPAPPAARTVERPQVAEAQDDVLRLSAEAPAAEQPATPGEAAGHAAVVAPPALAAVPAAAEPEAAATAPQGGDIRPVPAIVEPVEEPTPQPAAEPTLRETPGWRARR